MNNGRGRRLPVGHALFLLLPIFHMLGNVVRRIWWCEMATGMLANIHKAFHQLMTFSFLK